MWAMLARDEHDKWGIRACHVEEELERLEAKERICLSCLFLFFSSPSALTLQSVVFVVAVADADAVADAVVGMGGKRSPNSIYTTPDRPPLRLLCS